MIFHFAVRCVKCNSTVQYIGERIDGKTEVSDKERAKYKGWRDGYCPKCHPAKQEGSK